ncbi:MAG: hypothetical protein KOO61_01505 [Spirochaetales bacterium]|nr:hypothetical protein [Spirochaetales bacterium]
MAGNLTVGPVPHGAGLFFQAALIVNGRLRIEPNRSQSARLAAACQLNRGHGLFFQAALMVNGRLRIEPNPVS